MKITIKRRPGAPEETVEVPSISKFVAANPMALAKTTDGKWVSIERVYPVTGF